MHLLSYSIEKHHMNSCTVTPQRIICLELLVVCVACIFKFRTNFSLVVGNASLLDIHLERNGGDCLILNLKSSLIIEIFFLASSPINSRNSQLIPKEVPQFYQILGICFVTLLLWILQSNPLYSLLALLFLIQFNLPAQLHFPILI